MSGKIQFVEANDLRFAYLEQGSGPLVLFVHGFPDTAHTWDRALGAVAEAGYRGVAPFTRGYAPSSAPDDDFYGSDAMGGDIIALIDALGGAPAVVVGHDWGASASYSAAGLAPEKIRLLVTLAIPHPASMRPSLGLLWNMRHFPYLGSPRGPARARKNDFAYIDKLWRRWSPGWDVPASETDAVKEAYRQPGCLEAACGYYRDASVKPPPGQRRKVEVPAAAFAGQQDIIAPQAYERAASRFKAHYEVVPMPGGHFMHRQHPDVFNEKLLDVLSRLAPIGDGD